IRRSDTYGSARLSAAWVQPCAEVSGVGRQVQVLEDLQGVLPGPARGLEVTNRFICVAQVGQRLCPLKNRSRADIGEHAEGLLARANGRLELTAEPVHETEAPPRE